MERMKSMKTQLMSCIEGQMTHLDCVDTKELGEAIDMVKDLSEAIYYCTITEAMEGKEKENRPMYFMERYPEPMPITYGRDMDRHYGKMYYDDRYSRMYYGGNGASGNGSTGTTGSTSSTGGGGTRHYSEREYSLPMRDYREGRSPVSRRMYMESKETHQDKAKVLKDLDSYLQELSSDIVEMIEHASPEERQLLGKKLSTLTMKVSEVQ